jgi:hypothetical protein
MVFIPMPAPPMNTPKKGASVDGTCSDDAAATPSGDGLGLLLYASHASSMPNKPSGDGKVPYTITSVSSHQFGSNYVKNDSSSSELDDVKNNRQVADGALKHSHLSKTFPQILHEILSTPEYEAIIHWLPDGSSFVIADRHRIAEEILPKHFQSETTLFHSFIRKLNRWGFYRVNRDCKEKISTSSICYSHSYFLRDHPELCLNIRCKSRSKHSPMKVLPPVKRMKQQAAAAEAANRIAQKSLQAAANEAICAAKKTEVTRSTFAKKEQKAAAEEANSNTATAVRMNAVTTSVMPSSLGVERSGLYPRRASFGSTPTLTTAFAPKSIVSPLTLPVAAATVPDSIASVGTTSVMNTQDLEFLSSIPPSHLELLLQERERLITKMDQRRQLQMELQRLNDMSVQFLQSPIMRQYEYMLQKGALSRED